LSTIQRLETRIAKLEADLHRRQTSVAAHPPEIWMVQAKARPGETWPTDSTTRFFDGFLVEPVYYPDEVTPTDVAHAHLADDEDPDKGCWIKFHSDVFVHENTWLKVWRPHARGGQWFAFHGPFLPWAITASVNSSAYSVSSTSQREFVTWVGGIEDYAALPSSPPWTSVDEDSPNNSPDTLVCQTPGSYRIEFRVDWTSNPQVSYSPYWTGGHNFGQSSSVRANFLRATAGGSTWSGTYEAAYPPDRSWRSFLANFETGDRLRLALEWINGGTGSMWSGAMRILPLGPYRPSVVLYGSELS